MSYLVLDEGRPVRRTRGSMGKAWYTPLLASSSLPVCHFLLRLHAVRVKHVLYRRYTAMAMRFDPKLGGDHERCFHLWMKRAKGLRIVSLKNDYARLEEIDLA